MPINKVIVISPNSCKYKAAIAGWVLIVAVIMGQGWA